MTDELATARTLAREAGAILLEHYSGEPVVEWKGPNNPVTAADQAASRFLVGELKRRYPEDGVVSEEAADDPARLARRRVWIVDPMDGTKEFIARLEEFSVMIGLAVDGRPRVGVVHQPTTGKSYYAASGQGAFLEDGGRDVPLRVSPESDPERMSIVLSRFHHSPDIDQARERLGIPDSVAIGSLGLKVGLIAEGRAHLYVNTSRHTYQWDTCAPEVILAEAGGRMTDLANGTFAYNRTDLANLDGVLATNGAIHERVMAEIHAARARRS